MLMQNGGHLTETRYFIILRELAGTAQVLYHSAFMPDAVR